MLALLAALAHADDAALTAKLLGPEPTHAVTAAAAADPLGGMRLGLLVFGVIAVVGSLYWIRTLLQQHKAAPTAVPELRVVAKVALGGPSAVALVEVRDGYEATRFLVGYGAGGAPVLLTALSAPEVDVAPEPVFVAPEAEPEPVEIARTRTFRPVEVRDDEAAPVTGNALTSRFTAVRDEATDDLAARKAAARNLIDSALASKRRMSA